MRYRIEIRENDTWVEVYVTYNLSQARDVHGAVCRESGEEVTRITVEKLSYAQRLDRP